MTPKRRAPVLTSPRSVVASQLARARAAGPDAAPLVRVPELLVPVPPPMPPAAKLASTASVQGGITDREIVIGPFRWDNFSPGDRRVVCATSRAWRGVDVYLTPPAAVMTAGDAIHVRIFAVAQGVRAQVGGGFYAESVVPAGNTFDPRPVRVCAARAIAERFEIEVMFVGTGVVADAVDANVIAIAHNEAIDVPRSLGAFGPVTNVDPVPGGTYDGIRLLGVRALGGAAAAWALVLDLRGAAINGQAAKWSIPVPALGAVETYPIEADDTYFSQGFQIVSSTTPDMVTLGGGVIARAWIR